MLSLTQLIWHGTLSFDFLPSVKFLGRVFADFAHVADDESRHFMWCSQRLAELGFK